VTTTPLAPAAATDLVVPAYAGWGRRVVAAFLDGAVLGAVAWLVAGDAVAAPSLQPTFEPAPAADVLPWTSSALVVGAWLLLLVLQGLTGQTPGRRVLGIMVVRAPADGAVGGPPGVLRSVARWFAHLLDAILLLGYLRPLWHVERRTFADSIVGTVVVHRPPAPRGARRVSAVTAAAWVVVAVGLAAGVGVGEGGGVERGAESACELSVQDPHAPVQVHDVRLARSTAWSGSVRLWPWAGEGRHSEQQHLWLEASWDVSGEADPARTILVRATVDGSTSETEASLDSWGTSFPVEGAGTGPVDVEVLLDGRPLTACRAAVPGQG